jgi:transketolase C-terminal domain/subunit
MSCLDVVLMCLAQVMCIDSDLEGSTGLKVIHQKFPDIFVQSGIMERANLQAACGFGMDKSKQAIFSTFAAFQEMCISEITMGRLNYCNVLCHFSHSGVDDMADNSCHFGLNNFFADNGLEVRAPPPTPTSCSRAPRSAGLVAASS